MIRAATNNSRAETSTKRASAILPCDLHRKSVDRALHSVQRARSKFASSQARHSFHCTAALQPLSIQTTCSRGSSRRAPFSTASLVATAACVATVSLHQQGALQCTDHALKAAKRLHLPAHGTIDITNGCRTTPTTGWAATTCY